MTDVTLDDLVDSAGDAAEEAAEGSGKGTGEWVKETVQLLDERGLLEPMLFGPEGAQEVREQYQADAETAANASGEDGDDGLDLDAGTISEAGQAIMDELGEDVKVADLVTMCENNPELVNKKIHENL